MLLPPHSTDYGDNMQCISDVESVVRTFFRDLPCDDNPISIVLAVSGGPDSLCMADVFITLQDELKLKLVIAHINHGLRGLAADEDAEYVRVFAEQHCVSFRGTTIDVNELSKRDRLSIEEAARIARYQVLANVARECDAHFIALAHHADDQVETVLLRLIRGTGITGLQGMHNVSSLQDESAPNGKAICLLRPLLSVPRKVIETYCEQRQLTPRRDYTNDDRHHMRNRVRHDLLPFLEQLNPGIRKVVLHLAETAQSDAAVIEEATSDFLRRITIEDQPRPLYDRIAWRKLPKGLQRTTLRKALLLFNGNLTHVKYAGIEEARYVLNSSSLHAEIAIRALTRIIVTPRHFWFNRVNTDLL